MWHAGDIGDISICQKIQEQTTLRGVYGNIDSKEMRIHYPENLVFMCENVKVLITHIGGYPGKYPTRIKELIQLHQPQLFICGHSHILKIIFDQTYQLLHINPGAAGVHGFHNVKTVVRLEIDNTEIKNVAVIELGKRSSLI